MSERFGLEGEYGKPGRHERGRRKSARERVPLDPDFQTGQGAPKYRRPSSKEQKPIPTDSEVADTQLARLNEQIESKKRQGEPVDTLLAIRAEVEAAKGVSHSEDGALSKPKEEKRKPRQEKKERAPQVNLKSVYEQLTKLNGDIRSLEGDFARKCANIESLITEAGKNGESVAEVQQRISEEKREARQIAAHIEAKLADLRKVEEDLHRVRPNAKDKSKVAHIHDRLRTRMDHIESLSVLKDEAAPQGEFSIALVSGEERRQIETNVEELTDAEAKKYSKFVRTDPSDIVDVVPRTPVQKVPEGEVYPIATYTPPEQSSAPSGEEVTKLAGEESPTSIPLKAAAFTAAATVAAAAAEGIVRAATEQMTTEPASEPKTARQNELVAKGTSPEKQEVKKTEADKPKKKEGGGWSITDLPKDYKQSDRLGHTEALVNAATVLPWLTYEMGKEAALAFGRGIKRAGGFLWSAFKNIGSRIFGGK